MTATLPPAVRPFAAHVVAVARMELDAVAVYAVGSLGLGAWSPATSDVDLLVATGGEAGETALTALADRLIAGSATLPARRLELVVYTAERLARGDATFSMNLNVDRDGPATVDLDAATVPRFWFVLDLAIASGRALALDGEAVITAPPEAEVRAALVDAVDWFTAEGGDPRATALAACRALAYLSTGRWLSKPAAARWAADELGESPRRRGWSSSCGRRRGTGPGRRPRPRR